MARGASKSSKGNKGSKFNNGGKVKLPNNGHFLDATLSDECIKSLILSIYKESKGITDTAMRNKHKDEDDIISSSIFDKFNIDKLLDDDIITACNNIRAINDT